MVKIDKRKRECEEANQSTSIKKKRIEFCISSFRKKLKKAECIEALEEFLKVCRGVKGKDDPAEQYLKEGGQFTDILRILDVKNDISHVSVVFSSLQVLLLRVLTKVHECRKSAEEMCHHLLSSHLSKIHALLSVKSGAHHKKVVLQLLTAIVTLSPTLAKDVLSYVTISLDVVDNIVGLFKPEDPQNVRICFIQFLLAFLVEGNPSVITSLLLNKRLVLTSIVPGLEYDPSNLVIFVLTTLRTKLVEEKEILRTHKIHTFNSRVLSQLLRLYKWKGPAVFARKQNSVAVYKKRREAVAEAVHALFLVLCTSYRYGIVSHDRTFGRKSNENIRMNIPLIFLLKELDRPWNNPLLTDLTVQIVSVRPELSESLYHRVASVLEPRATKPWTMAVSFVTQIVTTLKLNELTYLEPEAALDVAKRLTVPRNLVETLTPGFLHKHPAVRLKTIMFLQAMLNAVGASLAAVPGSWALEFLLYVKKMIPNAASLMKSWSMTLKNSVPQESPPATEVPIPSPTEQMLALVDLMLLYQKHFPLLLDASSDCAALVKMLSSALHMEDINNENVLSLQLKILKLLTLLDTSVPEPGGSEFSAAVSILLKVSCNRKSSSVEAQNILGALLVKCKVLEPAAAEMIGEMGIWLESCQVVQPSQHPTLISFLQNVLVNVSTNPVPYLQLTLRVQEMMDSSSGVGKRKNTLVEQADYLFQELLEIANVEKSHLHDFKNGEQTEGKNNREKIHINDFAGTVTLSPVLMYIDTMKNENLDACVVKYLSCVLVHLLHMQSDPQPFISVVKNWSALPRAVIDYINSWSTETPLVLIEPFGMCSLENSLSRVLLGQSKNIPELEDCSNPIRILQLLRIVVFYITQFTERQQLTESVTSLGLDVLAILLSSLKEALSQDKSSISEKFYINCANLILKHPVLLCFFTPLCRRKRIKITENLVTNFILSYVEQITLISSPAIAKNSNLLLKDILLRKILHYLERTKQGPTNIHLLLKAVKILELTGPEMSSLMPKLIEKMTTEPWTDLICYVLDNVNCLPSQQVVSVGNKLVQHLQEDNDSGIAAWKVANSYQHYLKRFPHCVHQVPTDLFQFTMCEKGLELASVLLHHRSSYVMELSTLVEQNNFTVSSKVLFPLLLEASCHGPLPSALLKAVYNQYEENLFEAMQPPFSDSACFLKHADIIKLLIPCMALDKCFSLSQLIAQHHKKLGLCTPFHLNVLQSLQIQGGWKNLAIEFIEILLHQLKQMLQMKEQSPLTSQLCSVLGEHLTDNRIKWHEQKLQSDESWNMLPMLVLQRGLNGLDHHLTCCLFSAFARLLWRANEVKMAAQVFEMTISHSRFLDIVLFQAHTDEKLAVLQLILTCYELAPCVIKDSQIPIWLGAYSATLSHSDQVILKILCCLNNCQDVNLNTYRPFLWGEAAINHYSVRSRAGMSLWRVPQATVALELLQLMLIENTIAKFPLNRTLLFKQQENVYKSDTFISGFLENLEPHQPNIYDPAFLIPLLSHILAPESVVVENKFSLFGGLALTLAALGSKCGHMRTAALSVLSRFHARLSPKRTYAELDKHFLEIIRVGIGNLKTENTKSNPKKNMLPACDKSTIMDEDNTSMRNDSPQQGTMAPAVPNIFAVFLARASLILTKPLHKLYQPLSRFFLAKPALNMETVPGLLEFLRPESVEFRAYQDWLLETLQFGMRTEEDVRNAMQHHVFKMLFALYSSPLSNAITRILVLQLVEATLCVSNGDMFMIKCGILPWLHGIISSLQKEKDGNVIIAFLRVIVALKNRSLSLQSLVVPFLLKLPPVMSYADITCILQLALNSIEWISQDHLVVFLCLCESVLDHQIIYECYAQLGLPEDTRIKNVERIARREISMEEQITLCNSLRNVVLQWSINKYNYIPKLT